jgi:prepilin-type N-terminal cleavage/methylation domain-containing protein
MVHWRRVRGRRSFTLVELMVTIAILGILAAMMMGALAVTRASARQAATKATITKLHNIIMAKYESYRTRRVPLSDQEMQRIAVAYYGLPSNQPLPPHLAALIRLRALRDIMRMEMPERWTDVLNVSTVLIPPATPGPPPTPMPRTSLSWSYYATFYPTWAAAYAAEGTLPVAKQQRLRAIHEHAPSECLYRVVMGCGEDARRQFRAGEIGDTDNDGFPEFLDGWGRPIFFLRWAPGFNDSDVQTNVIPFDRYAYLYTNVVSPPNQEQKTWSYYNASDPPPPSPSASPLSLRQYVAQEDHDPFDPRRVDMALTGDNPYVPRGSRVVPLIYSAGPDHEYGVMSYPMDDPSTGTVNESWVWTWSEHPSTNNTLSAYFMGWGLPMRIDGAWVHFDNIDNHRIEMEAR